MNMNNLNDYNKIVINDINNIIKQITNEKKISLLEEVFIKMGGLSEITLKYKTGNEKDIKIFGLKFFGNNKNNYEMIINDEISPLKYWIPKDQIKSEIFEVRLIQKKKNYDLSGMFDGCSTLISINDNLEWDIKDNIFNISGIFSLCRSLLSLPDISKWNTSNVTNMYNIFGGCNSLLSLPDISKWNTSNVTDMSLMFSGCNSLLSLPDISKWDFSNVSSMNYFLSNCSKLTSLPELPEIFLFKGYMYEKQFLKFQEIFKTNLSKQEKKKINLKLKLV